ncbi:MAG: DUF2061 domain-containing protein [Candidatus Aminicenantes bacterium]|jgi:uncharacterized membrane protein|nr:DUF2061 domain-containing protein [Candidatus Aminicenantes bacterium]
MNETKLRSFLKSISWRIIATMITFLVALALTRKTLIALKIGALDMALKLIAYFLHERIWGKIKIGKKLHPLEDIKVTRNLEEKDKQIIMEKLKELGYLDE